MDLAAPTAALRMNCRSLPRTSHRHSCSLARTALTASLPDCPEIGILLFSASESSFSSLDLVQFLSKTSWEEDALSRLRGRSGDAGVAHNPHLHESGRKQQNKKPTQSKPYLLAQAWKLRQIDGPPQEPRKKARN